MASPAIPQTATVNYLNQDYNTSDPRKISANQQGLNAQGAQAGQQNATATQSYLDPIEKNLAGGGGGYTPDQVSQIEMSPQQQQNLITSAGISAGTGTAAGVDAAQRATDAAGGNPAALSAYRARAAQQEGAQAGDAMTQARTQAQQALAGETENVGQAQIGQQNVGLGLQQGYQQQQNTDSQNAETRAQTGVGQGLTASQTPSTFDKIVGGIGGALSSLEEGGRPRGASYLDEGGGSRNAVVAEGGPEAVVNMRPSYLDDGGPDMPDMGGYAPPASSMTSTETQMPSQSMDAGMGTPGTSGSSATSTPWYQKLKAAISAQPAGSQAPGAGAHVNTNPAQSPGQPAGMQASQSLGQGIGNVAKLAFLDEGWTGKEPGTWAGSSKGDINSVAKFLNDGTPLEAADGAIFTKPTQIRMGPNEAAVPLGYRAQAKTRPSMALPVVKQLQHRQMYGEM